MFDPEAPSPDVTTVNQDLIMFSDLLAAHYGLPQLEKDSAIIDIGTPGPDCIERVVDRTHAIQRVNGNYTFNAEDYQIFEDELEYVLAPNTETDDIARKLFVGIGVAGTALHEVFGKHPVSPLKEESHAKMVHEFFASHAAIDAAFMAVFDEEAVHERAQMTSGLTDDRAIAINGLRLCTTILYEVPGMHAVIGIDKLELARHARAHIRNSYQRDAGYYSQVLVGGLNQSPKVADRMFFNSLPNWVIAAATPMRFRSFEHLLSKAWNHDPGPSR